jgi:hypothetical protein
MRTARHALAWLLVLGPGLAAAAWVAVRWGSGPLGRGRALVLGAFLGVGAVGLSAVVVAYLPCAIERLGLPRLSRWLRTWWDPDAR